MPFNPIHPHLEKRRLEELVTNKQTKKRERKKQTNNTHSQTNKQQRHEKSNK